MENMDLYERLQAGEKPEQPQPEDIGNIANYHGVELP